MKPPNLQTSRLILRPLKLDDAPALQRHFARWEIIQNLSLAVPWPYPENGAHQFIQQRLQPDSDDLVWAITEKEAVDELIGVIDYMAEDTGAGHRGFWLGLPWQGRGYMTEAVIAVQDYLFFDMGLERMVVTNAVNNPASRRIKEKTGAKLLGRIPFSHRDGCNESEVWELTREGWARFRGLEL